MDTNPDAPFISYALSACSRALPQAKREATLGELATAIERAFDTDSNPTNSLIVATLRRYSASAIRAMPDGQWGLPLHVRVEELVPTSGGAPITPIFLGQGRRDMIGTLKTNDVILSYAVEAVIEKAIAGGYEGMVLEPDSPTALRLLVQIRRGNAINYGADSFLCLDPCGGRVQVATVDSSGQTYRSYPEIALGLTDSGAQPAHEYTAFGVTGIEFTRAVAERFKTRQKLSEIKEQSTRAVPVTAVARPSRGATHKLRH